MNVVKYLKTSVCMLLVAGIMQGCAIRGIYPPNWAKLDERREACSDISGTYLNFAPAPEDATKNISMIALLRFPQSASGKTTKVKISISKTNEATWTLLQTSASGEREIPGDPIVKFSCRGNALSWSGSESRLREDSRGNPLAGPQRASLKIWKGTDNALYIESSGWGAGLIYMFLPFAFSDKNWYRFPEAK